MYNPVMREFLVKRKKTLIILAVVITGFFVIRNMRGSTSETVLVRTANVENTNVSKTVSASGVVRAEQEANLGIPSTGLVDRLNYKEGDNVPLGAVLGNIYNVPSQYTVQAARDARDVALRDLDLYVENYESNMDAVGGRDEYEINVRRLRELLSRAEAQYQSQVSSLTTTYLKAPFAGTIVDILFEEGEISGLGGAIIKLANLDNFYFEAGIDQEDFGQIKQDQKVIVTLDSFESTTLEGKVSFLPLTVDSTTEEFIIEITMNETEEVLLPGMTGDVEVIIEELANETQSVTFDTVFSEGAMHYVWVVQDGKLVKKEVEVGLEGDIYTEVLTDLTGFEIVVPVEDTNVAEGATVRYEEQ